MNNSGLIPGKLYKTNRQLVFRYRMDIYSTEFVLEKGSILLYLRDLSDPDNDYQEFLYTDNIIYAFWSRYHYVPSESEKYFVPL